MRIRGLKAGVAAALGAWMALSASTWASERPGLTAFASMAELNAFIAAHTPQEVGQDAGQDECPPDHPTCMDQTQIDEIVVTGSRIVAATPSITNNQEAGVDEGDIVKSRGDTLIILRRGRLFTVDTGAGRLRLVDMADAYPPGVDASGDWYDEMLVSGDRVIVIGYSYERGGTEINRFKLDAAGRLTFEDSHHLKADDYYSSRNYASRLVGDQLVVYSPVGVSTGDALKDVPTLTRWTPDPDQDEDADGGDYEEVPGRPIITPRDVYVAPRMETISRGWRNVFHTVIRCDLGAPELACRATAILGPASRSFYVAPQAVYVWMAEHSGGRAKDEPVASWLYRIPLDGGPPQAAATLGAPIDQFSFEEDPDHERINVMVVSDGDGDGMWRGDSADGEAALLQLPFSRFGDGLAGPVRKDYRLLPPLESEYGAFNRFVGGHLIYTSAIEHDDWENTPFPMREGVITIVPVNGGPLTRYTVPGRVSRIEAMGTDGLVVSGGDDVLFTTLELQTPRPTIGDQYVLTGAAETESRSHAFFYRPDASSTDGATGVMGLPVGRLRPVTSGKLAGRIDTVETIAFLRRNGGGRLGELGGLDAADRTGRSTDDGCQASCYGWYGDARPIFLGDRIFALLGYEVIEGRERDGRIREIRRIDMTPAAPPGPRPYYAD